MLMHQKPVSGPCQSRYLATIEFREACFVVTEGMDKSDELAQTLYKITDSINAGETLISTLLEIASTGSGFFDA